MYVVLAGGVNGVGQLVCLNILVSPSWWNGNTNLTHNCATKIRNKGI